MSTEMSEDIRGKSQSRPNVNRREKRYKTLDRMKERKSEWKGALKSTQNMGKDLHKAFKNGVQEILQHLPHLHESCSEVSYFTSEPRNFAKVTKLLDDIMKPWMKSTKKEI